MGNVLILIKKGCCEVDIFDFFDLKGVDFVIIFLLP